MGQHRCVFIVQFEHEGCQGSNSSKTRGETHSFSHKEAQKAERRTCGLLLCLLCFFVAKRVYGRARLGAGRLGVLSGMTFSVLFNSAKIAFASAFKGLLSGATSTKC